MKCIFRLRDCIVAIFSHRRERLGEKVSIVESKFGVLAKTVMLTQYNHMKILTTLPRLLLGSLCPIILIGDIRAANPAEAKTIGRVVRERADLSNFLKLLEKTEIGSQLSERTTIRRTVFAPTNAAFEKLSKESIKTLLDPKNDDRLEEVFGFHVVERSIPTIGLEKYAALQMATGPRWME